MVFIKTVIQKNKDGSERRYFYLAENYREGGKIKIRILRPISEEDALTFRRERDKEKETTNGSESRETLSYDSQNGELRAGANALVQLFNDLLANSVVRKALIAWGEQHPEQVTQIQALEAFL